MVYGRRIIFSVLLNLNFVTMAMSSNIDRQYPGDYDQESPRSLIIGSGLDVARVYPFLTEAELPKQNDITVDLPAYSLLSGDGSNMGFFESKADRDEIVSTHVKPEKFCAPHIIGSVRGCLNLRDRQEQVARLMHQKRGSAQFDKIWFQKVGKGLADIAIDSKTEDTFYAFDTYVNNLVSMLKPGGVLLLESERSQHKHHLLEKVYAAIVELRKVYVKHRGNDFFVHRTNPAIIVLDECDYPDNEPFRQPLTEEKVLNKIKIFYSKVLSQYGFNVTCEVREEQAWANSRGIWSSWFLQVIAERNNGLKALADIRFVPKKADTSQGRIISDGDYAGASDIEAQMARAIAESLKNN